MGQTVGEIDLGLNINQSLFNKQITGLAKSAQAPIVNAFKPIGKLIGGALAVGSIVKFTKECLDLGSDLTEVQNVVDTTFKTLNGAVNEFAANAMNSFGMSETVAKQYMGTLGAMSKSMGFSEQASYDMAAAVTGLAGDVASFYNLSTDEAFNKLKSIWTGETETLKSIGVLLTQTNLDQYALNNGFGKTTASMTEQEKVMLRYQYTMSALADASGDFAKTSGSWANQTRILSLQFDSLKATLGQGFINLFTPIIQMINTLLAKLQVLAQQFKAFTEMLVGDRGSSTGVAAVASDAENAAAGLGSVEEAAKKAAKATRLLNIDELNVVSNNSATDTSSIGTAAANVVSLNNATTQTGGLIGEVNTGLESLTKKIEPFISAVRELWNGGLSKLGSFTATGFKDFYESFLVPLGTWAFGTEDKGFTRLVNIINEDLCGVDWDTINKNLKEFWAAIEPYAENFGEGLIDFFEDASDVAFDVLEDLFGKDGLLSSLTEILNDNDPEMARKWGYALGIFAASIMIWKIGSTAYNAMTSLITNLTRLKSIGKIAVVVGVTMAVAKGLMETWGWLFERDTGKSAEEATTKEILIHAFWDTSILNKEEMDKKVLAAFDYGANTPVGKKIIESANALGITSKNGYLGALALVNPGLNDWWTNSISPAFDSIKQDVSDWMDNSTGQIVQWATDNGLTIEDWSLGAAGLISQFNENAVKDFTTWYDDTVAKISIWVSDTKEDIAEWSENIVSTFSEWKKDTEDKVAQWYGNIKAFFGVEEWSFTGIKDGLSTAFTNACNAGIDIFNKFIDGINEKMHFSWDAISVAGVEIAPAGDMQLFSIPHIQKLAEGGYVGPNQPRLTMIGDNKRYGEIVSPEDKMQELLNNAVELSSGDKSSEEVVGLLYRIIDILIAILEKDDKISDDYIVSAIKQANYEHKKATGKNII